MRYIAGELLNFLELARTITPSPALDANFPASRLYDGYADAVALFGSNAAGPSLTVDLAIKDRNGVDNGNLDAWSGGLPTGWEIDFSGTGSVAETTTAGEIRSGSAAKMRRTSGSYYGLTKFYRVRAGQRFNISLWCRIAGAGSFKAWLYNPVTKKFLTSGGAWTPTPSYFTTEAASTSYVEKTLSFVVESMATCQAPTTLLQLGVMDQGTGGGSDFAFVDDVFLWPTWNAIVVAGHNIEPGMAPEMRASTDNFSASNVLEASMVVRQPSFWALAASEITKRYARLVLSGTQSSLAGAAYIGEFAVTYLEAALRGISGTRDGYSLRFFADNIVSAARWGRVNAARITTQRRRSLLLPFRPNSDASWLEQRDEITARCHGALWPLILVPLDSEDVVLHARLDESWQAQRLHSDVYDTDLVVSDNPFPIVTS